MVMQYRHIFFDLDHTLWDFDLNAREALLDLYEVLGLKDEGVTDFEIFYTSYLHHNKILWDRYHHGYISTEELKWKRMWRTLLDFKIGSEPLARNMSATFLQLLPEKQHLFPYAPEILTYLREKGYGLHLITNGFEETQWRKLRNSRLDGYFAEVITSERSGSVKPNPGIFEYALKRTGASLRESIMIGDNPDADIEGALNMGMDCIFVNHGPDEVPSPATYSVRNLRELESIL
jgi:putative hydrolase of the HAD superfamily